MNRKTNIMYIIVIGHFVKVIYINSWISYAIDICKSIQKYAKWNNSLNNIDWTVKYNEINYAIEIHIHKYWNQAEFNCILWHLVLHYIDSNDGICRQRNMFHSYRNLMAIMMPCSDSHGKKWQYSSGKKTHLRRQDAASCLCIDYTMQTTKFRVNAHKRNDYCHHIAAENYVFPLRYQACLVWYLCN